MNTLSQQLFALTNDEQFQSLHHFYSRTNPFRVCGMSHMELWHSQFMGWLLNPKESHRLGMVPLQRYLLALTKAHIKGNNESQLLQAFQWLQTSKKWKSEVISEKVIDKKDRLDIFACYTNEHQQTLVLTVEHKIHAPLEDVQFYKYEKWVNSYLQQRTDESLLHFFVGAIPSKKMKENAIATFGSPHWFGLDYQTVLDEVLYPCLHHPLLDPGSKQTLRDYIDALGIVYKNEKLAMTQEEKEKVAYLKKIFASTFVCLSSVSKIGKKGEEWKRAKEILSMYPYAFDTIQTLIQKENPEEGWNFYNTKNKTIESYLIFINREELNEKKLKTLLKKSIIIADACGVNLKQHVGFKAGKSSERYFFHDDPTAISSLDGRISVDGKDGNTYYIATGFSGEKGMELLESLLTQMGLQVEYQIIQKESE